MRRSQKNESGKAAVIPADEVFKWILELRRNAAKSCRLFGPRTQARSFSYENYCPFRDTDIAFIRRNYRVDRI